MREVAVTSITIPDFSGLICYTFFPCTLGTVDFLPRVIGQARKSCRQDGPKTSSWDQYQRQRQQAEQCKSPVKSTESREL